MNNHMFKKHTQNKVTDKDLTRSAEQIDLELIKDIEDNPFSDCDL